MAEIATEEWFAAFQRRLDRVRLEGGDEPFALGQEITGLPAGTVGYTISCAAGRAVLLPGTDHADVTLVEDVATARSIEAGTPVAELLLAGRIKVRGALRSLQSAEPVLARLAEALGSGGPEPA